MARAPCRRQKSLAWRDINVQRMEENRTPKRVLYMNLGNKKIEK